MPNRDLLAIDTHSAGTSSHTHEPEGHSHESPLAEHGPQQHHPHAHAADPGPDEPSRDAWHAASNTHGPHEHDGVVHSHEPDLAQKLATLTSKLSEHYLEGHFVGLDVVVTCQTTRWGEQKAHPSVYRQLESPPPRLI